MERKQALFLAIIGVAAIGGFIYYRKKTVIESEKTALTSPAGEVLYQSTSATPGATTVAVPLALKDNAGIVNNNPLNIKWTADSRKNPWVGQTGENRRFVVFSKPEYSFRAGAKILQSYAKRGVNTLEKIVATWAPASDNNNVKAYVTLVSKVSGLAPSTLVTPAMYPKVLQGMAKMETSRDYPLSQVQAGVLMA